MKIPDPDLPEPQGGIMKNDQQDGDQGRGRLQTENLDATGELPANNNGHETAEPRQEIAAESSGKQTVSSRKVEANRRNASKFHRTPNTNRKENGGEERSKAWFLFKMATDPAP